MKNENYKHPIFIAELINKPTVSELFYLMRGFEGYQKSILSTSLKSDNTVRNYGLMIDNYHFEGDEKETKIFIIGLILSSKKLTK